MIRESRINFLIPRTKNSDNFHFYDLLYSPLPNCKGGRIVTGYTLGFKFIVWGEGMESSNSNRI